MTTEKGSVKMTYLKRMRDLREDADLTQQQVADYLGGVSYTDINYQIIPASYALIHVLEPEYKPGTVYAEQYCRLSEDIAWLLRKGFSVPDGEWLTWNFFEVTGKPVNTHLLYEVSHSSERENRFEDYLATRIMQDSGKNQIDLKVSQQMGILLSIENAFGTVEKFYSM